MKKILAVLLLIITLAQCKTAQELIEKGDKKDSSILPKIARTKYPCITTATKTDSTEFNKWKDRFDSVLNNQPIDFIPVVSDTVRIKDSANCPDQLTVLNYYKKETGKLKNPIGQLNQLIADVKPIHDTAFIEDSAKLKLMAIQIAEGNKAIAKNEATIVEKDVKIKRRGKYSLYLLIALCVSLTINYFLIRRK